MKRSIVCQITKMTNFIIEFLQNITVELTVLFYAIGCGIVNGVQVERIIPRLRDRSERQARALMAQKARQKKSAWWWPGNKIRPAEYERVRRAEKEIFNERRRISLKPKHNSPMK